MIIPLLIILVSIALIVTDIIWEWSEYLARAFGIGFLVVFLVIWPACYLGSVSHVAKLEAFYQATQSAYTYAINETSEILTVSKESVEGTLIPVEGSVEKFQVGESAAQRILEFRDAVETYNNNLNHVRALDAHPLIGALYATPKEDLLLITVK